MTILYLIPVWFFLGFSIPIIWSISKAYRGSKGPKEIVCPEISLPATIQLDVRDAVKMRLIGNPVRKIQTCSRWPERQNCDGRCLSQLA
jgi:hypothetical protein